MQHGLLPFEVQLTQPTVGWFLMICLLLSWQVSMLGLGLCSPWMQFPEQFFIEWHGPQQSDAILLFLTDTLHTLVKPLFFKLL
jgi:hypothetical protein